MTLAPPAAFAASSYVFSLAENADGGAMAAAVEGVSANTLDPLTISYTIIGGNDAGWFAIDAGSGAGTYIGDGEDAVID